MSCENVQERISLLLDRQLEADERGNVLAHLESCRQCETRLESIQSLRAGLRRMAAAEGDNIDIFAYYAEPPLIAVNLFHLRNGQIVDRREFFWEDQHEFDEPQFFSIVASTPSVKRRHPHTVSALSPGAQPAN